jgi:tetratricopeptide (TPR) repeat protein
MKELSPMVEQRQVPNDFRWMGFLNGMAESNKGNYAQALEHYSKSWPDVPFIKYYVAVAYEKMGEKEKATELYKEIENWKQNELGLALVKQRIRKMAAN